MAVGMVEVEPGSVERVLTEMRSASRQYSSAGWRMSTNLPLMPPLLLARAQAWLDVVAARLQALAVTLEIDAAVETRRLQQLVGADASEGQGAMRLLQEDLRGQGGRAWEQLMRESGPEAWIDPVGGSAHLAAGLVENISQLLDTAATIGRLNPTYASVDPGGARRARQEAIAMAINLVLLFPESAMLDPGAHDRATTRAGLKAIDWADLQRGDVPRWVGHVGSGFALAGLTRGLASADEATAAESTDSGVAQAFGAGYEGVGHLNRLPTDRDTRQNGKSRSPLGRVEDGVATFLEGSPGR